MTYTEIAHYAIEDPVLYEYVYSISHETFKKRTTALLDADRDDINKAFKNAMQTLNVTSQAIFGDLCTLYRFDCITSNDFIRACETIDEKWKMYKSRSTNASEDFLSYLGDMYEQLLTPCEILRSTCDFDENGDIEIDKEYFNECFREEYKKSSLKNKIRNHKLFKVTEKATEAELLKTLLEYSKSVAGECVNKYCNKDSAIRHKLPAYLKEAENLGLISGYANRCAELIGTPAETAYYFHLSSLIAENRYKKLSDMGAPNIILIHEAQMMAERCAFRLLAKWSMDNKDKTNDEKFNYISDKLLSYQACAKDIADNSKAYLSGDMDIHDVGNRIFKLNEEIRSDLSSAMMDREQTDYEEYIKE